MRRLLTAMLDLITGDGCAGCGMPGPPLCAPCRQALPAPGSVGCARCGHPWPRVCAACPQCPPGVAWARQALAYDAAVPVVVGALKDHHRRSLAGPLARVMCDRLERPPPGAVLVPVPLGARRQAERGFNQAALLTRALAERWHVPWADALVRADGPAAQRGSGAEARRTQVHGVFRAVGQPPVHCVLVDDVLTTGATVSAAARALRAAGCARVGAVALARVVLGAPRTRVGRR